MNWTLGIIIVAVSTSLSWTQTAPVTKLEFAVASVKPRLAECTDSDTISCTAYGVGKGKATGRYVTLKMLIGLAYQVHSIQILGGPSWVSADRFDMEAKADDPSTEIAQLRLMMRSLLEDRFNLKLHRETKKSPAYALVVGRSGQKLRASSDQISPDDTASPRPEPGERPYRGGMLMGAGMLVANAVRLSQFAKVLTPQLDREVIDKTNLEGRFDIQLHWTPERFGSTAVGVPTGSMDAPSIFTAIQEQLGLRLESVRELTEVLIIDHAEKPTAN